GRVREVPQSPTGHARRIPTGRDCNGANRTSGHEFQRARKGTSGRELQPTRRGHPGTNSNGANGACRQESQWTPTGIRAGIIKDADGVVALIATDAQVASRDEVQRARIATATNGPCGANSYGGELQWRQHGIHGELKRAPTGHPAMNYSGHES